MLDPTFSHGIAIKKSQDQVFLVGGGKRIGLDDHFLNRIEVFDMMTQAVTILPVQLSVGRTNPACTVLNNENLLIVAGGQSDGWSGIDTVEIIDLNTNTRADAQSMPFAGPQAWSVDEFIFNWDTLLYQYEVKDDQWVEIENVPFDLSLMKFYFVQIDAKDGNVCSFV